MPYGIFPVPRRPPRAVASQPSFALWIRTRWRRRRLDEELSHGADPAASAELALRTVQLCSRTVRSQLATALVNALDDARGAERFSIAPESHLEEIRDCADDLLALAVRLQDNQPVAVRGAAMTALLVADVASPLDPSRGQDLRTVVRAARCALDTTSPTVPALSHAA